MGIYFFRRIKNYARTLRVPPALIKTALPGSILKLLSDGIVRVIPDGIVSIELV